MTNGCVKIGTLRTASRHLGQERHACLFYIFYSLLHMKMWDSAELYFLDYKGVL